MSGPAPVYAVRARKEQRDRWQCAADACGMPLAAWLKATADQAVASGHDPAALRRDLADLRRQLAGAANNLNQIAYRVNAGGSVGPNEIAAAIEEIDELRARVSEVLR